MNAGRAKVAIILATYRFHWSAAAPLVIPGAGFDGSALVFLAAFALALLTFGQDAAPVPVPN